MLVFARLVGMWGAQSIKEGKMLRKLVITGIIGACAMPAMAANLLTNSAVDPFGKIPEFKFSAVKVENAKDQIAAE